jgi:hypothetical protein
VFHRRHVFAKPRSEPLEVWYNRIADVLLAMRGELDGLDVEFLGDERDMVLKPLLMRRIG